VDISFCPKYRLANISCILFSSGSLEVGVDWEGRGETASSLGTQTSDFIYLPSCGHVLGSGLPTYY